MKLIFAFLPWILFALLSHAHPEAALLVALATTAIQVVNHLRRPKILELVSLAFFSFSLLALYVWHWREYGHHLGLFVHLLLASVAWGSLFAGIPFTLQYAREETPSERWHEPIFVRTNQWITVIWGTDFLLQAAVLEWQAAAGGTLPTMISATLTGSALLFTLWYPKRTHRLARERAMSGRNATVETYENVVMK
jgi:all-trans-retinol 13,14-reductase